MPDDCARKRTRLLLMLALYTLGNGLVALAGLGWEVLGPPSGVAAVLPILMMITGSVGSAAGTAMIAVLRRSGSGGR